MVRRYSSTSFRKFHFSNSDSIFSGLYLRDKRREERKESIKQAKETLKETKDSLIASATAAKENIPSLSTIFSKKDTDGTNESGEAQETGLIREKLKDKVEEWKTKNPSGTVKDWLNRNKKD
jgi:hypothetical protein